MIAPRDFNAGGEGTGKRRFAGWLPLLVAGVIYTATVATIAAVRADPSPERGTSDFRDFWLTGRQFLETGQLRSDLGVHNYLPFFQIFMAPWSLLPLRVATAVFTVFSMSLLGLTVAAAEALRHGAIPKRPSAATLVALVLCLPYVTSCAVLGQVNLLLLFLVMAAFALAQRGREWFAGVPLGLAILIKLLPAALLGYFLLRREWRTAASALAVVAALGAGIPAAAVGWREAVAQHAAFYERAVVEQSARATIMSDHPHKAKYTNQSLPIVLRRLLSPLNGDPGRENRVLLVNVADWPRCAIWWLYVGLATLIVGSAAVATWRGGDAAHEMSAVAQPQAPGGMPRGHALFGAWCCVMLLATPLLWTHYFMLAYWPVSALAAEIEPGRRTTRRRRLVATAVLAIWAVGAVLLAAPAARAAGAQLWCVLLVGATLLVRNCDGANLRGDRAHGQP